MSYWTRVQGYIILDMGAGPKFGKYANDPNWDMLLQFADTMDLISMFLTTPRNNCMYGVKSKFALSIEWSNIQAEKEDYEYFTLPSEDQLALQCPSGSEGPIEYFITPILRPSRNGFFIGFLGDLRDREDGTFVINWWNTIKKYLPINAGHISVNSSRTHFEETYDPEAEVNKETN